MIDYGNAKGGGAFYLVQASAELPGGAVLVRKETKGGHVVASAIGHIPAAQIPHLIGQLMALQKYGEREPDSYLAYQELYETEDKRPDGIGSTEEARAEISFCFQRAAQEATAATGEALRMQQQPHPGLNGTIRPAVIQKHAVRVAHFLNRARNVLALCRMDWQPQRDAGAPRVDGSLKEKE